MTSAVITLFERCSCDAPLSIYQYYIEEKEKSGMNRTEILLELGFRKPCCLLAGHIAPMPYIIDSTRDMFVDERTDPPTKEDGYVSYCNKSRPPAIFL